MKIHHLITALAVFTCTSAFAADRWFDAGTTDIVGNGNSAATYPGATSTWDTTIKNWDAGAVPHTNWVNANLDNAIFGGTPVTANRTVTLSVPVTVGKITFLTGATNLSQTVGGTGDAGTLTFGGAYSASAVCIDASAAIQASISGKITGTLSGGMWITHGGTIANSGRMFFGNTGNDFVGDVNMVSGFLHARSSLGAAGNQINLRGGSLYEGTAANYPIITRQVNVLADGWISTWNNASGSNSITLSGTITGSGNLTHNQSQGTGTAIFSGDMSAYTGNVTNASGYLYIQTTVTSGGGWVLNGGTTTITTSGDDAAIINGVGKKDLVINGGTLDLNGKSETINGLSGGSGIVQNQVASSTSTLTLGDGDASGSFTGTVRNNSGSGGTFAITKMGSGMQTLNGANITYTGATAVNNGTLTLSNCTAFASAVTVTSPGVLELGGSSGTWNFGQAIGGTGALTKTGAGSVHLSATCGYGGATDIKAGTLSVLSANTGTGNINVRDGATLAVTASGSQLQPGTLTVGDSTGASLNFSNINSTATGPVVAGTLALNGTITVTIKSGTFSAGTAYPLISYTTPPGAGTIISGPLPTLPALTTGYVTNNTTLSRIEFVVTSPALTRLWSGSVDGNWDLSTLNWDSGTTAYLDAAALTFDDTATGSTTVTNLVSPSALPLNVVVSNITKNYTVSGNPIGGSGSLTKTGNGMLTLANTNSYSGGNTVSGGTLRLGDASGRNGVVAGNITDNAVVEFANPAAQTYSGAISGTGSLVKSGAGTLTLNATHSYGGGSTISGGTLQLGDGSTANGVVTGNITNNAALAIANPNAQTVANVISGTGTVAKSSAGILTLSVSNSYTGATTISNGRVNISNSSALGTADAGTTVNTGAELHLTAAVTTSEPLSLTGNGSGSGALSVDTGSSTWNGPVTATGDTVMNIGTALTINGALNSGGGTLMKIGTAALTLGASNSFTGPFTITNGTVTVTNAYALGTNNTVNVTYGSAIGGQGTTLEVSGGLNIPANVTLNLTASYDGANSYRAALKSVGTGTNVWNGPILLNGDSGGITACYGSSAAPLILNGPILGTNTTSPNFYLRGNGVFTVNGWVNMPNASFATTETSTVATVNSITNVWAQTAVSYGRLVVGTNNALCTTAPVTFGSATVSQTGTLDLGGWSQQVTGLERLGAGAATIGSSSTTQDSLLVFAGGSSTYGGTIVDSVASGTRKVAMAVSSGSLILTNAGNSYSGNTTISGGTLALTGSGNLSASAVIDVQSGGTFDVSGRTSGLFTLASGMTLKGGGTVNGSITAASGSTVSAGASPGSLTITNALTFSSGSTNVADIDLTGTPTNDVINAASVAFNGGTLVVNYSGPALAGGESFQLFNAASYSGAGFTSITPALSAPRNWWFNTANGVLLVNRAPTATNFDMNVTIGGSTTATVVGKFATDPDGNTLTLTVATAPINGTAVVVGGTDILYTSTNGAAGDSFSYTVNDGRGGTATATVNVTTYSAEGFNLLSTSGNVMNYLGIPGQNYALEHTTDLTPPIAWTPVITNTAAGNGSLTFTNIGAGFYRTHHVP